VCWVEPRLIATEKHFGRTDSGALRADVLRGLAVVYIERVPENVVESLWAQKLAAPILSR
jgi:hypothetical protein